MATGNVMMGHSSHSMETGAKETTFLGGIYMSIPWETRKQPLAEMNLLGVTLSLK